MGLMIWWRNCIFYDTRERLRGVTECGIQYAVCECTVLIGYQLRFSPCILMSMYEHGLFCVWVRNQLTGVQRDHIEPCTICLNFAEVAK